jgi:serine/threonine-protein kinase
MHPPGYEILGELGRGGMGVVYKARQVHLDRLAALKMILAGAHATPEDLARFGVEARAAARLDHPNIIRIYDSGECRGRPYFSMELVTGGSLAHRLIGPLWPVTAAVRLIRTLALAMHHAHQNSVVHRDLKPANVLFHHDGTPKVTDFGLAKQLDSGLHLTDTGRILGTVHYMAPEQAAGDTRSIGPATDTHALGVTLYEMLTGRPAFDGPTLLDILERIRSTTPIPPTALRPGLPTAVEAVCLRCLAKDPVQRFRTADELARSLERCLDGTLDPAEPPIEPDSGCADCSQWWRL